MLRCFRRARRALRRQPVAPWDGRTRSTAQLQDVGTGTDFPDPDADPFCVEFDKTSQNVTDFGIVDFLAKEPARVAAAAPKCFYFQRDHWTGSIVQGGRPSSGTGTATTSSTGRRASAASACSNFRVGGTPFDATPYAPPEYAPYFAPGGGGGVIVTEETDPDPSCAAKVDSEPERAAVYSNLPDFGNCVAPGGKIRARKVGRARLGAAREAISEKVGPVERSSEVRDVWCVVGGGAMSVRFGDGDAAAIRTTTPGHSIRGVGPGDPADDLREAGFERLGGGEKTRRFGLPGHKFGRTITAGVRDAHRDLAEDDRRRLEALASEP